MKISVLSVFIFSLLSLPNFAQNDRIKGPVIYEFGPTFRVNNPEIETDTTATLKVIFDVAKTSEDRTKVNPYIETAARFLNMHVAAGFKAELLEVAMTIHGAAWQDIMTDKAYQKKNNINNPNTGLLNALSDAGVDIIICGQTAGYRKLERSDVNSEVKFALSAMTSLLQYQNSGYRFIKF